MLPWPASTKRAFTDQQFQLQHQHYLLHHPDTDFLVIEHTHVPVGRYYLQKSMSSGYLLVDISLFPEQQGRDIGSELIRQAQRNACEQGATVRLHVQQTNPRARQLYERLGFVAQDATATHIAMLWRPGIPPTIS